MFGFEKKLYCILSEYHDINWVELVIQYKKIEFYQLKQIFWSEERQGRYVIAGKTGCENQIVRG